MSERSSLSEQPKSPSWLGSATEFFTPLYELLAMSLWRAGEKNKGVPKGELNPQETDASSSHKQLTSFREGGGLTVRGRTGTIQKPFPLSLLHKLIRSCWQEPRRTQSIQIWRDGKREREKHEVRIMHCKWTVCRSTRACYEMKHWTPKVQQDSITAKNKYNVGTPGHWLRFNMTHCLPSHMTDNIAVPIQTVCPIEFILSFNKKKKREKQLLQKKKKPTNFHCLYYIQLQ